MRTQQILDHLYEASNGLSMGWAMANVPEDATRNHVQAPINAGQESVLALIRHFESQAAQD